MLHLGLKVKGRKIIAKLPFVRKDYFCICCQNAITHFDAYGGTSEVYEKHHIIGGGRRNCKCPICESIDRWRWTLYVLHEYTKIFSERSNVLHFAPEAGVKNAISLNPNCWYMTGDLLKENGDIVMDITDIPFKDNLFDYIIVNHVMSYVKNEKKAMDELKRCLKPSGTLIMSFPICTDRDTYENLDIRAQEESMKLFGVTGNCRMYGKDYRERIEGYGFTVEIYSPQDILKDDDLRRWGLMRDDILMLCRIQNKETGKEK